jgi:hypothetical protein
VFLLHGVLPLGAMLFYDVAPGARIGMYGAMVLGLIVPSRPRRSLLSHLSAPPPPLTSLRPRRRPSTSLRHRRRPAISLLRRRPSISLLSAPPLHLSPPGTPPHQAPDPVYTPWRSGEASLARVPLFSSGTGRLPRRVPLFHPEPAASGAVVDEVLPFSSFLPFS